MFRNADNFATFEKLVVGKQVKMRVKLIAFE